MDGSSGLEVGRKYERDVSHFLPCILLPEIYVFIWSDIFQFFCVVVSDIVGLRCDVRCAVITLACSVKLGNNSLFDAVIVVAPHWKS